MGNEFTDMGIDSTGNNISPTGEANKNETKCPAFEGSGQCTINYHKDILVDCPTCQPMTLPELKDEVLDFIDLNKINVDSELLYHFVLEHRLRAVQEQTEYKERIS